MQPETMQQPNSKTNDRGFSAFIGESLEWERAKQISITRIRKAAALPTPRSDRESAELSRLTAPRRAVYESEPILELDRRGSRDQIRSKSSLKGYAISSRSD
jgi:hypothetical protein